MTTYRPLPPDIEIRLCVILGLSDFECRVLNFTRKAPMQLSSISHLAKIPRGSIAYIVKKLHKRKLLIKFGEDRKHTCWRSNLPAIFREIQSMKLPSLTDWIGETSEDI